MGTTKSEIISVIGAGAWGTTLARLSAQKGYTVRLWCHPPDLADEINEEHENIRFLPQITLPENVVATAKVEETLGRGDAAPLLALFVVPSQFYRNVVKQFAPVLPVGTLILSATKGIEQNSLKSMAQILLEELPEAHHPNIAVLSGPNLAREIAQDLPTAAVVAASFLPVAEKIQQILSTPLFRIYTSTDRLGVELGGALKNMIAIAAGTIEGLGLGDNARSALMSRGIAEISRLGVALGAKPETFSGLAGIGDLIVTCMSSLSRNHHVGMELAHGRKLPEILTAMSHVAEGVPTAKAALALAKQHGIEMPITEQIHEVLFAGKDPRAAIAALMERDPRPE